MQRLAIAGVSLVAASICATACAEPRRGDSAFWPGESFQLEASTGNYIITYVYQHYSLVTGQADAEPEIRTSIYEPSTKVDPRIHSTFALDETGQLEYRFAVSSLSGSRQAIRTVALEPISNVRARRPVYRNDQEELANLHNPEDRDIRSACSEAVVGPQAWFGSCVPAKAGIKIWWSSDEDELGSSGLSAGQAREGYGFTSPDLPGIGVAAIRGDGKGWRVGGPENRNPLPGDRDGYKVSDALRSEILRIYGVGSDDHVARFAAIPRIEVPSPFDCAVLLERVRDDAKSWPAQQLMDAGFNVRIVGLLDNAIAACRAPGPGNSQANAIKALNHVRAELRKTYPGLNAEGAGAAKNQSLAEHDRRLAARVLDFNVNYVSGRLTGKPD